MSKKRKKSGSSGIQRGIRRNLGWIIAGGIVLSIAVAGALAVTSGGSSSDDNGATSARTATPDPRIAGATPAARIAVESDDEGQAVNPRFVPNLLEGPAAQPFAIDLENVGTVAHNLRVSGVDKQYDTADDFTSATAQPDKAVELMVKINTPGSYPFRCDFHPQQVGTLVLN